MFPAELATGLCSLNPRVDRLVQSCLMEVTRMGEVAHAEFHDGVINSDARMTYTEVNAILTDRDPDTRKQYAPLVPLFERMRAKVQGTVWVEAVVLPDGTVGQAKVVRSLDSTFGLDEEALKAAKQWRFAPGTRFGQPVAVLVTIELTFTLR